jgi:hypothetical protein
MPANEYIRGVKTLERAPFNKKIRGRNYYEHVIRNREPYQDMYQLFTLLFF